MSSTSLVRSSQSSSRMNTTWTTTTTPSTAPAKATPQARNVTSPQKQAPAPPPTPQTPGNWRHPRLAEILRRKNANAFDSRHVRAISTSIVYMLLTLVVPAGATKYVPALMPSALEPLAAYAVYAFYAVWAVRVYLLANIYFALRPLLQPNDTVEDIPLTPSQRQLLGLPPSSRPVTPESCVTPPRYSRSSTPRSSSASPLGGRGSPLDRSRPVGSSSPHTVPAPRQASDSPYNSSSYRHSSGSSYQASPLAHKALLTRRRDSYGASSAAAALDLSDFDDAGRSAVPRRNSKATVQLNSKWLYDKGRGSPQQRGILS